MSGPGNITLTDAIGRTLRVLRVDAGVADISIQTHGLVSGAYYYRIQTEETSHSGILLKH